MRRIKQNVVWGRTFFWQNHCRTEFLSFLPFRQTSSFLDLAGSEMILVVRCWRSQAHALWFWTWETEHISALDINIVVATEAIGVVPWSYYEVRSPRRESGRGSSQSFFPPLVSHNEASCLICCWPCDAHRVVTCWICRSPFKIFNLYKDNQKKHCFFLFQFGHSRSLFHCFSQRKVFGKAAVQRAAQQFWLLWWQI